MTLLDKLPRRQNTPEQRAALLAELTDRYDITPIPCYMATPEKRFAAVYEAYVDGERECHAVSFEDREEAGRWLALLRLQESECEPLLLADLATGKVEDLSAASAHAVFSK